MKSPWKITMISHLLAGENHSIPLLMLKSLYICCLIQLSVQKKFSRISVPFCPSTHWICGRWFVQKLCNGKEPLPMGFSIIIHYNPIGYNPIGYNLMIIPKKVPICLVVTGTMDFFIFPNRWDDDPIWRSHIFFRGVGWNHQPGQDCHWIKKVWSQGFRFPWIPIKTYNLYIYIYILYGFNGNPWESIQSYIYISH